MAFLTDRTLATGVTINDLIHIVVTGDTSQNPAGSSYKATISQVTNLVNSVVITGGTYNNTTGEITFVNSSGGTFTISGFVTGFTDTSVTAFTYDNVNTFTIYESNGSTFSATINTLSGLTYFLETTTGVTTSAFTITSGITYWGVNYNGNVDVSIPDPTGIDGYKLIIKDEGGYSGSYRIRLTPLVGTIDGNSYVDMNINYMSLTLVTRNNNWWLI
jgi:hypothetical protein